MTGASSRRAASAKASTLATNSDMISGFSGFPKFRQSVTARARAPFSAICSAGP